MSGILFISSHYTGYGHKSITESLQEQLKMLKPGINIYEVDGFMLGGAITGVMSKMYNKVVVHAPLFWKICYKAGDVCPSVINFFSGINIKRRLLEKIDAIKPDLIVTVHPAFVSPVLDALENHGLKIPVVVMVADLDNVSALWADKRSVYTVCPTGISAEKVAQLGVPEDRIKVLGFPTRQKFNNFTPQKEFNPYQNIIQKDKIKFLIMNGSQGMNYVTKIAEVLLNNFNCHTTILAGNNKMLKASLEDALLPVYQGKVTICGFTENVEQYMSDADILIIRASPNVLMEAVNLCKPIIVTGALTGQEEKNPDFVQNNNLGVVCKDISKLPEAVKKMLLEDGKQLNEIYQSQVKFRCPDAAKMIAQFLLEVSDNGQAADN